MERADRRAEGTALAMAPPIAATRQRIIDRPSVVIDLHPGFVRLPAPVRAPAVRRRLPALLIAFLALAAVASLIALRHPIVAAMPQLGGVYAAIGLPVNLLGVELDDVSASRVYRGGYEQLRVQGAIVSVAGETVELPPVEVILVGADGGEIGRRTALAAAAVIAPGGMIRFAAEFPDLPAEAATISVRLGDGRHFEVH